MKIRVKNVLICSINQLARTKKIVNEVVYLKFQFSLQFFSLRFRILYTHSASFINSDLMYFDGYHF